MIRRSWTRTASIEETLALWAASLREIKQRIRPLFRQERVATNAGLFLEGLLGDEQRKTGWMRAEAAGDPGPWRQQAILGRRDWDADALRDIVRDYVIEHLADDDAVLVIDETGFLKQGKASCGVARQYTGSAGKITNCQIGVFAAYVSRHGHAFIDRALYLPKEWTDDPDRLEAAYVPADIGFATKPKLATAMIARAIAASVPFQWVAGDTVYGVGDIEQRLRRAGKGYVLGVSSAHVFRSWGKQQPVAGKAADIARARRPSDWKRLSAGAGTKGPRLHDWCYLELADLEAEPHRGRLEIRGHQDRVDQEVPDVQHEPRQQASHDDLPDIDACHVASFCVRPLPTPPGPGAPINGQRSGILAGTDGLAGAKVGPLGHWVIELLSHCGHWEWRRRLAARFARAVPGERAKMARSSMASWCTGFTESATTKRALVARSSQYTDSASR